MQQLQLLFTQISHQKTLFSQSEIKHYGKQTQHIKPLTQQLYFSRSTNSIKSIMFINHVKTHSFSRSFSTPQN